MIRLAGTAAGGVDSWIAVGIGAAAAILGGFLAALYQSTQTRKLALEMRSVELQEEAVLRLAEQVGEIVERMGMWLNPSIWPGDDTQRQTVGEAGEYASKLRELWRRELSWKVKDNYVREGTLEMIELLDAAADGGYASRGEIQAVFSHAMLLATWIEHAIADPKRGQDRKALDDLRRRRKERLKQSSNPKEG